MIEPIRKELENAVLDLRALVAENEAAMPLHSVRRWSICSENNTEERSLGYEDLVKPDYGKFLYTRVEELSHRKAFVSLADSLKKSPAVQHALRLSQVSTGSAEHDLLFQYVLPLTIDLMEREKSDGAQMPDALREILKKLDEGISREVYTVRYTAPLLNFGMNADEVALIEGLRIVRITDDDLVSYGDLVGTIGSLTGSLLTMRKLQFQIEAIFETRRTGPRHHAGIGTLQDTVQRIQTALRLVKKGAVGILFERGQASDILGQPGMNVTLFFAGLNLPGSPYLFDTSDVPRVLDIYATLPRLRTNPRFALALGRFLDSYGKPLTGDRIIDDWIGLEALFLPDGSSGELKFKASLRLARFIAAEEHMEQVFKAAQDSYNVRSGLVHGTKNSASPEEIETAENLLRSALVQCLTRKLVPDSKFLTQLVLGKA